MCLSMPEVLGSVFTMKQRNKIRGKVLGSWGKKFESPQNTSSKEVWKCLL